jgi:hypothetical protein
MLRNCWNRRLISTLGLAAALLYAAGTASAASINYGSFGPVPPGVTFGDVTESSATDAVPLYGAPAPFATGLDFDPAAFAATSSGGAQDITDGQLNFSVTADPSFAITSLNLFEAGDFTLAGAGTNASQTLAGAILRVTVTQIGGVDVAPIGLSPVNASVGFNLAANPGVVQPWSLGLLLNVAGQLDPAQRATRIEVVIDNQLLTFSESATSAFIAKKDFRVDVGVVIPEPSTALLLLGACTALAALARERR